MVEGAEQVKFRISGQAMAVLREVAGAEELAVLHGAHQVKVTRGQSWSVEAAASTARVIERLCWSEGARLASGETRPTARALTKVAKHIHHLLALEEAREQTIRNQLSHRRSHHG